MANGSGGSAARGGVTVVVVALIVLAAMAVFFFREVGNDEAKLAIATAALGVITAIVGAFFGVNAANQARSDAQQEATNTNLRLNRVLNATDPNNPQIREALSK